MPLDTSAPRTRYDIAYACFLLIGLAVLLGATSIYIDLSTVLFPLSYLSWIAVVVGVGFSIRLWRHAPLPILAALTVLFVLVGFFVGIDELMAMDPEQQEFWFIFITAVHWVYGITASVVALWWFFILRRRGDGAKAVTLYHDTVYGAFLFLGLAALWIAYVFPWEGPSEYIAYGFLGLLGTPGISMTVAIILFAWFAFKSKDTLLIVLWLLTVFLLPFGVAGGPWLLIPYAAAAVIFSTWWFGFARRKKKRQV